MVPQLLLVCTDLALGSASDDLFRFSSANLTWTKLDENAGVKGTVPSARYGHTMTAVGDNLYLLGGSAGPDFFRFSVASLTWTSLNLTAGLYEESAMWTGSLVVAMTAVDQDLYVISPGIGRSWDFVDFHKLYKFSTTNMRWTTVTTTPFSNTMTSSGPLPSPLGVTLGFTSHTMTTVGQDLYLMARMSDNAPFTSETARSFTYELFRFSTVSLRWTRLDVVARKMGTAPSVTGGLAHAMTAVGSDLYVFGGYEYEKGDVSEFARPCCFVKPF